jgi:hypothetical protein
MSGAARPDHEVGGPGAERRQDERYGKNDGSRAHGGASAMGITPSVATFPSAATASKAAPSAPLASTLWSEPCPSLSAPFAPEALCKIDVMGWEGAGMA